MESGGVDPNLVKLICGVFALLAAGLTAAVALNGSKRTRQGNDLAVFMNGLLADNKQLREDRDAAYAERDHERNERKACDEESRQREQKLRSINDELRSLLLEQITHAADKTEAQMREAEEGASNGRTETGSPDE
jgi:hypothetical protein